MKPYLISITEIEGIELPAAEDNSTISSEKDNIIIATGTSDATEPVQSVKHKRGRSCKYLINIYIADLNEPDITVFVQDESEYH